MSQAPGHSHQLGGMGEDVPARSIRAHGTLNQKHLL